MYLVNVVVGVIVLLVLFSNLLFYGFVFSVDIFCFGFKSVFELMVEVLDFGCEVVVFEFEKGIFFVGFVQFC